MADRRFNGLGRVLVPENDEATRAFQMLSEELMRRFGSGSLSNRAATWGELSDAGVVRQVGQTIKSQAFPIKTGSWNCATNAPTWNRGASTGQPWTGGTAVASTPPNSQLISAGGGFLEYYIDTGSNVFPGLYSATAIPTTCNMATTAGNYQCDFHVEASVGMASAVYKTGAQPILTSDPLRRDGGHRAYIRLKIRPSLVPDGVLSVALQSVAWSLHRLS